MAFRQTKYNQSADPVHSLAVRPATPEDAEAIAEINVSCWQDTYRGIIPSAVLAERKVSTAAAKWREYLLKDAPDLTVLVAEGTGQLHGFGSAGAQRDEQLRQVGYDGEITALYVSPIFEGHGIGSTLIHALGQTLRTRECRGASLWVLQENAKARRFYEKHDGVLLSHTKVEPRLGDVVEVAYGWPDLARTIPHGRHSRLNQGDDT